MSVLASLRTREFLIGQAEHLTLSSPRVFELVRAAGFLRQLPYLPGTVGSWYDARFSESGWVLTRRILLELRKELDSRGVPLVILIMPSSLQVEPEKQKLLAKVGEDTDAVRAYLQDRERPQRLLREFCSGAGLQCVDCLPALVAAYAHRQRVYYPIDQHWTPAGHRIAAELVDQRLRELSLTGPTDLNPSLKESRTAP